MELVRISSFELSRRSIIASALMLAICPGFARGAVAADDSQQAQAFIETLVDKAIRDLTPGDLSREERISRARTLLNENFALPTIARFVLGASWRTSSDAQRAEFVSVFKEFIVLSYVDRFARYSGEKLVITKTVTDAASGDVIVQSQVDRPGNQSVNVGWRVRKIGGVFQIVDVIVEGVSMGQTQRSEFASVIRNNNGSVDALMDEMRARIKR